MAELLIMNRHQQPDTHKDHQLAYRAGDVVAVCPDGWHWTEEERNHPRWTIVKIPGVDPKAFGHTTIPMNDQLGQLLSMRAATVQGALKDTMSHDELKIAPRTDGKVVIK